jgi:hypothetical protein
MSTLAKLKLIASKRQNTVNPTLHRRKKLTDKIKEQIEVATALKEGRLYAPKKLKSVKDADTGLRSTVETTKRVKEWFWTADNGKINVSVRYGSKVIELAKGKNAVEVGNVDDLIATLALIKDAVDAGELDDAINAASDKLRSGFSK